MVRLMIVGWDWPTCACHASKMYVLVCGYVFTVYSLGKPQKIEVFFNKPGHIRPYLSGLFQNQDPGILKNIRLHRKFGQIGTPRQNKGKEKKTENYN